ncbi:MFS transporter [Campylobacter geochelonis]|uniref:Multidrug DMT transporter permease n=1 Tax=Campylobacter geochelonis TaxID=1780362 RepID=A0A128EIU8_9BACT|nr:MFS transporter [Campylobacter geochelonis]CZE48726.1 multidrug DMT transporter permease [Campylobacter geochelonis]
MNRVTLFTKLTLLFMGSAAMLSNLAVTTAMPHLKQYFNSPFIELYSRLMITLPALSIALLSPFLGIYIAKFGKRNSALVGFVLFTLFGSAGLYLAQIEALLLSRFLLGIGIAVIMIVTTSLVGDYFEGEARYKFMSLQNSFMAAGGAVFVIGGGVLTDIFWRLPFGVYLAGLLFIPAVILHIFDVKKVEIHESSKLTKPLYFIFGLGFLYMVIFFILPTQMPFLIMDIYGASGKLTGAIIATSFVGSTIGAIFFSPFKAKFGFAQIFLLAVLINSLGLVGVGIVKNIHFFFLTSFIIGFGGGLAMTNMSAWMLSYTNIHQRVKASSLLVSAIFLGQFISPFMTFPVVAKVGIQNAFLYIGIMLLFIVVLGFLRVLRK